METIQIEMYLDKSTKGTHRYAEDTEDGNDPVVPTQYIKKTAFDGDPPNRIRVTIEAVED